MDQNELQSILLEVLADPRADHRLGRGANYLAEAVQSKNPQTKITRGEIQAAYWSIVAQGLAYIDIWQHHPENWKLCLTESGNDAVKDLQLNPANPSAYLKHIKNHVPTVSDLVLMYLEESLKAFNQRLLLSSTVMLGVAAEAALLECAVSLGSHLVGKKQTNYIKVLQNPIASYRRKLKDYLDRLNELKSTIPGALLRAIHLQVIPVVERLRIDRNQSGHPTGAEINRSECFSSLVLFSTCLKALYELKNWLDQNAPTSP